ncbi:MAG TPA: tetratricopeptide repeat protein [Verrucomicrobiales bacterium]|jgi:tetratricopeptide (TPR) repeat protein|nr:tetratricopeptide repeat protein [Verrucomicrobiales bacterium]
MSEEGSMREMPPDQRYHLSFAEGWLELGNSNEAEKELLQVDVEYNEHPDYLEVRWLFYEVLQEWGLALEIAEDLTVLAPERASGWIHQSYCLHELNQTYDAFKKLLMVKDRFPDVPTIPYNLACYACRLGRIEQAREWLETACRKGDAKSIRDLARKDPDLQALWEDLEATQ